MQQVCAVDAHSRPQKCQSWAHEPKISPLRGLTAWIAPPGAVGFFERGARENKGCSQVKSRARPLVPRQPWSGSRRCSRSAEQSPPESGVASTCAPSLAANQWAWLKPHPQLLAEGAAIAVALHDRCRRGHRRPRRRCNCRRRHCWRAAAAAGPPPPFLLPNCRK